MTYCWAILIAGIVLSIILGIGALVIKSWMAEFRKDRVPTLLYHRFLSWEKARNGEIRDDEPIYACYDKNFEEQMKLLSENGYHTISISDYVDFVKKGTPLPKKPVIITFDDGFLSNYLYAFPILKRYNQTATIFMTVDRNSENFKEFADVDGPLSDEQLLEMHKAGISIQSHTMTHPYLTDLPLQRIRWEFEESRRLLEGLLESPVEYMAIPSGACNRRIKQVANETGYQAVYCMNKGSNNARSDLLALRRIVIGRDFTIDDFGRVLQPYSAFQLRITGFFQHTLLKLLGPRLTDKLRNALYKTKLEKILMFSHLKTQLSIITGLLIISLVLGIIILKYMR